MKKKIAIIGAGIAGLTLANLLKKHTDHEFMVYEREESLSLEEGYGIQLATNSIKILNQINFDKINNEIFNLVKETVTVKEVAEICKKYNPKITLRETNDEVPNLGFSLSNKKS